MTARAKHEWIIRRDFVKLSTVLAPPASMAESPNVADEKGPLKVSQFTPHMAAYWTSGNVPYDRALLTHRVKTMFGFDELAAAVDKESKEKAAYEKLRLMM